MLFAASYWDLKNRLIPNAFPLCIGAISLFNFHFSGIILALPFLISGMIDPEKVGGGDIKLVASIGVFLGYWQGLTAVVLALLSVLFVTLTCVTFGKRGKLAEMSAPLAPYLTFGVAISYLF
ncbi:MAG: prepilin peptidase [Eubacteriales bacterium]